MKTPFGGMPLGPANFWGGGELNLNPLYGWSVEHTLPNILVKWARNPKHDQKPLKM